MPPIEPALISVILPCYNREESIAKAIDSVRAQSFQDWELLVVDDGSQDNSVALITQAAEQDARIQLVKGLHEGVSSARNRGMAAANGQVFAYLDSDNSWRPEHLEAVWQCIGGEVNASCYTQMQVHIVDDAGAVVETTLMSHDFHMRRMLRRNLIDMNTYAHSRDLYTQLGDFDESMTRLCDWDVILRYCHSSTPRKIDLIGADYFHHRSENRVSMNARFLPNRLRIALKSHPAEQYKLLLYGFDQNNDWANKIRASELVSEDTAKSPLSPAGDLQAQICFWHAKKEEVESGLLRQAALKFEFDTAAAFCYLGPEFALEDLTLEVYLRFHFIVVDSPKRKTKLQELMHSLQKAKGNVDVNPIDRILVEDAIGEESLPFFLELMHEALLPSTEDYRFAFTESLDVQGIEERSELSELRDSLRSELVRQGYRIDASKDAEDECVQLIFLDRPSVPPTRSMGAAQFLFWANDDDLPNTELVAAVDFIFCNSADQRLQMQRHYPMVRCADLESNPAAWQVLAVTKRLLRPSAMGPNALQTPRVLYVAGSLAAASTRKRSLDMFASIEHTFTSRLLAFSQLRWNHVACAELIVIQRWVRNEPMQLANMWAAIARLRRFGKTFVYDIDDLVLQQGNGLPLKFISTVDHVSCSTPTLRDVLMSLHDSVEVIPNFASIDESTPRRPNINDQNKECLQVTMVSTDALAYQGYCELAEKLTAAHASAVSLNYVCSEPVPAHPLVRQHNQLQWSELQSLLNESDILVNIAESSEFLEQKVQAIIGEQYSLNSFIHCKSALKYLDAGSSHCAFVGTRAPRQYQHWVTDGVNGILVDSPREVFGKIDQLIRNPELLAQLKTAACRDVYRRHTQVQHWPHHVQRILGWHNNNSRNTKPRKIGAVQIEREKNALYLAHLSQDHLSDDQLQLSIELRKKRGEIDTLLTRLEHYKRPMSKRFLDAIAFRFNRFRASKKG